MNNNNTSYNNTGVLIFKGVVQKAVVMYKGVFVYKAVVMYKGVVVYKAVVINKGVFI